MTGDGPTVYDKLRRRLLDNWWVAVAVLLAGVIVSGVQVWGALRDLVRPSPPRVTVLATVEKGAACGPSFAASGVYLFEQREIDIGINNQSDRDILLKRVRLVPGWFTGGFYAGEIPPGPTYDVALDEWMGMLVMAKGHSDRKEEGQAALVAKGLAKNAPGTPTWFIQPGPIEVKALPAAKYTVKRQSQERFRIRLGLGSPLEVLEGPLQLEIEPDVGPPVKSAWLSVAVCTPDAKAGSSGAPPPSSSR